jgi:signal transduction histidine kinase
MTHATVPAHLHAIGPQPPAPGRLARHNDDLARRGQQVVRRQAAERERRRLARELHDGAIQEVLAAGLTLDLCLAELPEGSPLRAKLEEARRLTSTGLRRLRSLLQNLRESAGTGEADMAELPDMLERLRSGHPGGQLDVSVEVTGTPVPLGAEVRRSLFRVASECVFNAAVHARARQVAVRLNYGCGVVALTVADDGHGKPKTLMKIIRGEVPGTGSGYHVGLADVAARTEELGGTLLAKRSDLGGIAVQVLLPMIAPRLTAMAS